MTNYIKSELQLYALKIMKCYFSVKRDYAWLIYNANSFIPFSTYIVFCIRGGLVNLSIVFLFIFQM